MTISPETRLKRYLCYTYEENIYHPGCRFFHKRYREACVPSLKELLAEKKEDFIFDTLKNFHDEQKSCFPEALLFVLSELARDKTLRQRALKLAEILCEKTDAFVIFLKFSLEYSPKIGFGRSFRKFVRQWYSSKDHLQLAEIVGEMRKIKGWCHADFMKLAHVKVSDPAKQATLRYAINGLEAMKKDFGEVEEAKPVISYLETVDTYKKKLDGAEVAAKIDSYMLSFCHINFKLHDDKKVWLALLKQMPVLQLLQHFQFISKKKMLRNNRNWDFVFVDTVIEALTKPYANRTGVTTSRVFIELMNYENAGRVKMELATKLKKTSKKPPIIHSDVSAAFLTLIDTTFEGLKATGKRIMIAIELSNEMQKRRCKVSRYITLSEAAVFLAYYFVKKEPNVKVFTFNATGMKPFAINKESSVKTAIDSYKAENIPEVPQTQKNKGDEIITLWLKEHGSRTGPDEVDVCIILKCYLDNNSLHALGSQNFGNNKKIKFIVSDLCAIPKTTNPPDRRHLLVTSGFDEKLAQAMSLFISDAF